MNHKDTKESVNIINETIEQVEVDHTQTEFQLRTCNEIAEELISILSDFEVAKNNTKRNFETEKQNIQNYLNSQTDKNGSKGMYINIMQIQLDDRIGNRTLWEWAKNISKITNRQKNIEAIEKFKSEFYKTYFNKQ